MRKRKKTSDAELEQRVPAAQLYNFSARGCRHCMTRASVPQRRFSKKRVEGDEETRIRRSIGVDVALFPYNTFVTAIHS